MSVTNQIELLPASAYSIDQLVATYNQTRIDYIVPMPMNVQRLAEYMYLYDVDPTRSFVASMEQAILGLAMLGVRGKYGWITRLGVLPNRRKVGIGETLVRRLMAEAEALGLSMIMLEVIVNNEPAYQLFLKNKFEPVDELLVLRRPPRMPPAITVTTIEWLQRNDILELLDKQKTLLPWTHQVETFRHALTIEGCRISLADGSQGWGIFRRQPLILSHIILHTEVGDPTLVGKALLSQIHRRHPYLDTHAENIRVNDPHYAAYRQLGYIEVFRRNEMYYNLT